MKKALSGLAILGIVLVVIIAVYLVLSLSPGQKGPATTTTTPTTVKVTTTVQPLLTNTVDCNSLSEPEKSRCLQEASTNKAITTRDESACASAKNPQTCNDELTKSEAIVKNDIAKCNSIVTMDIRNSCRDEILVSTAMSTKDANLCLSISNQELKDFCQQNAK